MRGLCALHAPRTARGNALRHAGQAPGELGSDRLSIRRNSANTLGLQRRDSKKDLLSIRPAALQRATLDLATLSMETAPLAPRARATRIRVRPRPQPQLPDPSLAARLGDGCCNCARDLKRHLADFCDNTSVHGLKYMAEPSRPCVERLLWVAGVALSLGACAVLVAQTWARWRASPVIVAMDETQRPVWEIPFPAVTVCPVNKLRASAFNFSAVYRSQCLGNNDSTQQEEQIFLDLFVLCDKKGIDNSEDIFRNINTVESIEKFSPQMKDTIYSAEFRRKDLKTHFDFQPILTEEGLCFSFNMMQGSYFFRNGTLHHARRYLNYRRHLREWTPSEGYAPTAGRGAYPFRATASGAGTGLSFTLRAPARDLDAHCRNAYEGYKVQLHSPAEFPRPAERSFRAPLRGSTALRVTPAEMATDADVRGGYSAQQRRCYFPDERRLAFFRLYSQSNCEIECLANLTLRRCGCVPFHMPRFVTTVVCGTSSEIITCVMDAEEAFQDVDFRASGEGEGGAGAWWRRLGLGRERERAPRGERDRCSCLQTCAHLSYEGEASSFEGLAAPAPAAAPLGPAQEEDEFYTTVSINFKDTYFIPTRRIEMFGTIDFIANCGGLLGLSLGVSVLSVLELIYWLLVRPCCSRGRPAS